MRSLPTSPVTSIFTAGSLANWLGVDPVSEASTLTLLESTATEAIIQYLEFELLSRDRVAIWQDWPTVGTDSSPSLSPADFDYLRFVELPFSGSIGTVASVEIYGEATAEYTLINNGVMMLDLGTHIANNDSGQPAIKVLYTTASYANEASVLAPIKSAALLLASYLYEHRGECSVDDAMKTSGAAMMLYPYKRNGVVL